MRKLIVRNFSVIQEAELEFGKITVLIGPQASGKSLLCKLAFFFGRDFPEFFYNWFQKLPAGYLSRMGLNSELFGIFSDEFANRFPRESWGYQDFQIEYLTDEFHMRYSKSSNDLVLELPDTFRAFLDNTLDLNRDPQFPGTEDSEYIPTGRAFFSIPNKDRYALVTKNLDRITELYALVYDSKFQSLIKCYQSDLPLRRQFASLATEILKGKVINKNGRMLFQSLEDSRERPFEILSSGTLELLPIINSLSRLIEQASLLPHSPDKNIDPRGVLFVEEPELSIFPSTQYGLIRCLAWMVNTAQLNMSYAITTHSPYILTAFNTLIEAWRAGNKPGKREQVAAIIPEHFWVSENDFAAYSISNGVLTSIFEKETEGKEGSGLIDGNFLDSVSDQMGSDFEKLLDIEYAR